MSKPYRRIQSIDNTINKVQDSVEESIKSLNRNIMNGAVIINNVIINTTDTPISHGLNREVKGWFVIDNNSNSTVWRSSTPSEAPTKILLLKASNQTTISLVVF